MSARNAHIVRRSVALPKELVEQAIAAAPPGTPANLNRLVTQSLREFVARRKAQAFASAMAEMAADPAIRKECASIDKDFAGAGLDGLDR